MPKVYKTKKGLASPVHVSSQDDIVQMIYKPKKLECHRIASIFRNHLNEEYSDESSYSYKMQHCGEYLKLDTPYQISTGEVFYNRTRVIHSNFCRNRFCPMCQYRLSRKTGMNLSKCIKVLHDVGYSFIFMTFTMPNVKGSDLDDAIRCLNHSWSKFYHLKDVALVFKGYFKALEVTYNKDDDTYHPHLHLLVCVNKSYFSSRSYIKREKLIEKWVHCLNFSIDKINNKNILELKRDDFYLVDIRRVKDDVENFHSSVLELSKYVSKSSDINDITFEIFFNKLYRVRGFEYIGDFKTVYRKLNLNDELLDVSTESDDIGHILSYYTFDYDDMIYALRVGDK